MPAASVLAASSTNGLLLLLIAVVGFVVVAVVAALVLALLQAVLPGGDSEADRLYAEELERQQQEDLQDAARVSGEGEPTAQH